MRRKVDKEQAFASTKVPLYYQLGTILREQIVSGHFAAGDRLPTEIELVESYGVSRITVRQALKSLEEEKLVRREAGRGTFVTGTLPRVKTLQMNGSLDDLISMGLATSIRLLDLRRVVATPADVEALGVEEGDTLVQCTRLRYYHKEPYSYIINRLPEEIADRFGDHDWEQGAILQTMEEQLGMKLKVADQQVRATLADALLARHLNTRIGAPLLLVDRIVRIETGEAVERVRTYYRGDIYSLTVHLTRQASARSQEEKWALKEPPEAGS